MPNLWNHDDISNDAVSFRHTGTSLHDNLSTNTLVSVRHLNELNTRDTTCLTAVFALVRVDNGSWYDGYGVPRMVGLPSPFGVFERGPGGTIFDLHDPWFGITGAFGKESDRKAFRKRFKRSPK